MTARGLAFVGVALALAACGSSNGASPPKDGGDAAVLEGGDGAFDGSTRLAHESGEIRDGAQMDVRRVVPCTTEGGGLRHAAVHQ